MFVMVDALLSFQILSIQKNIQIKLEEVFSMPVTVIRHPRLRQKPPVFLDEISHKNKNPICNSLELSKAVNVNTSAKLLVWLQFGLIENK